MKWLIPTIVSSGLLLAACGNENSSDRSSVEGPVVSPSEAPRNSALGDNASTLTPGANSFTEGQARAAIEGQGFTNIGPLTQDNEGIWSATATKNGNTTTVSVDYKGTVASK